jgi:hypothetical protein
MAPVCVTDRDIDDTTPCSFGKWREMVRHPTLRPLMLVIPYFLIQQFSGIPSIRPYMLQVFREFGLGDAAEWTTVNEMSHNSNLTINCAMSQHNK